MSIKWVNRSRQAAAAGAFNFHAVLNLCVDAVTLIVWLTELLMVTIALGTISLMILVAEFYFGIAVTGWLGDDIIVERVKTPGPYWMWMALHTTICIGLPVLSWFADV